MWFSIFSLTGQNAKPVKKKLVLCQIVFCTNTHKDVSSHSFSDTEFLPKSYGRSFAVR